MTSAADVDLLEMGPHLFLRKELHHEMFGQRKALKEEPNE